MKKPAQVFALLLLLQFLAPAQLVVVAQKPKATRSKATESGRYAKQIALFEEFVRKQMALDRTVGLTIGFMKDDFVWIKGYGYADLENKVPAKAESAYRLASVTKSMTAIAIMQLVEKGKINLDAEVQTYVPYFPKKQWPITVRQVLGHLGGISHYKNPTDELHIKTHRSTREAVAIFENFDLVAEPGTRYSYSSYGYNLLGAVIEGASGMSYGDYMRVNVWGPLGMSDTRMDDPLDVIPNRVRGYQLVDGQVRNSEFVDISSRFSAGGTRSTVPDLLKFARGIIDGKLLTPASMKVVTTSMSTRAGRLTDYAMGWETTPYNGRYFLAHSGGQQETRTLLYILPSQNFAIAVAVNFEGSNPGAYTDRLFQVLNGAPTYFQAYSGDKLKSAFIEAMNSTFNYGLSYYEHMKTPLVTNQAELAKAFAYFNQYVNSESFKSDPQATLKKIREGVHPVATQAFASVGSYMARRLAEKQAPARLKMYPALGSLTFFQDYISMSQSDPTIPKEFRLNESFAKLATEMAVEWNRTNTQYVRSLWLLPDVNLDELGRTLRRTFAGASVYPNLDDDFFSVTRQLILSGDRTRALKAAQLGVELYPEAAPQNSMYGLALILSGEPARAEAPLQKATSINPNSLGSAGGLNRVAYELAGAGKVDDAVAILKTAVALYPKDANLYDSLGEFYLKKGDKAKALEHYKKALEINPNFPNAAAAREIVKRLTSELGGQ
jgi:CubicO group peptidase (beta-lactamase class C family)/tetratricopeptide (TPR) repeat protein